MSDNQPITDEEFAKTLSEISKPAIAYTSALQHLFFASILSLVRQEVVSPDALIEDLNLYDTAKPEDDLIQEFYQSLRGKLIKQIEDNRP